MDGNNPGLYHQVAQTEWWPFIPALGVVLGFGLALAFGLVSVLAAKRQAPVLWAAIVGLIATVVLGASIIGCSTAAAQWEERDLQHYELYVSDVAEWASGELEIALTHEQAAQLLAGASVPLQVDGRALDVLIEADRSTGTVQLVVNQP